MSEAVLHREAPSPALAWLEARLDEPLLEASLAAPLRDFLARPGKGLRARMITLAWEIAGGPGPVPEALPLAVELLHAGSLIVDDIEDGSAERRGSPSLHVAAGLPVALNAGNWLYFAALDLLGTLPLDAPRALHALRRANALLLRCHEGQALDVGTRVSDLAQRDVPRVVRAIAERKTGGLTALGTTLAAICAGAPSRLENALALFGTSLGSALQLLDDVGAICSEDRRAKGEEDLGNGRATAAWALAAGSLDPALYQPLRAMSARVERGEAPPGPLLESLREAIGDSGRHAARRMLSASLAALRRALREPRVLREAEAIVNALESSYG